MESIERHVQNMLSQMTLEEKLAQIGSYWIFDLQTSGALDWDKAADKLRHGIGQITRLAGASTLEPVDAAKTANALQRFLVEKTRTGIPAIFHEECCSGAVMMGGTVYPQMLGLASSFQPELAEAMTTAIRAQLLAIGARQGLAPVLDVARDPRWGRVEETFGEDPTLVSHFGMAYVRGLQSSTLAEGVMATAKHFVGHGLPQGGLNCAPVHLGMREIFQDYLAPFQAVIREAKVASVMNAYPELDSEVVAASRRIMTDLLRHEMGFDGLVVSDYEAIIMLHTFHKIAASPGYAASLALKAGIDVELPDTVCYGEPLKTAVQRKEVSLELVDQAVARHLRKKIELGLFDNPYVDEGKVLEVFETPGQRKLAREIARKTMVLLKNNGLLPLPKSIRSLAVIGPNADEGRNQLGDYTYAAMSQLMQWKAPENSSFSKGDLEMLTQADVKVTTVLEGIRSLISPDTAVHYAHGYDSPDGDHPSFEKALQAAQQAEVVVLVLGDRSGLTLDCSTGETRDSSDLKLPGNQEELAEVLMATGIPVVVVLITGRPYSLSMLAERADAILEAWLPGEEGGNAIAEVLFGDVNPGGKLPITFPRSVGQVPIFYNSKPAGTKSHWYEDYVTEKVTPLYPFGHGLSYTDFEYRCLTIQPEQVRSGELVDISLDIENIGQVSGEEVVQLYIHDVLACTTRPIKELKGYQRLKLEPGEVRQITFHLDINQLAFYDLDLRLVLEAGQISVMVGSSSQDIRLRGVFEIVGDPKVEVKERVFTCPVSVV
jgi:beta-glucosidase